MTKYYLTIDVVESISTKLPSYVDSVLSVSTSGFCIPYSFHIESKYLSILNTQYNLTSKSILIEYYSVAKDREMKLSQLLNL